ncbi:hypothetical protein V8E55_002740 [Tylopilus felleus]
MSDDLQSIMAGLVLNNYMTATVIAYDYVITLPREINYIWNRPWTWVSTLFVVVRYVGCMVAFMQTLFGSTFLPGPTSVCTALILIGGWANVPFLAAADLVIILRLWAMYRGSKIVLGVLLLFYIPTIVLLAVTMGIFANPKVYMSVSTSQVLSVSVCNVTYSSPLMWPVYAFIPRCILAVLVFIFALVRLLIEFYQTYKASDLWEPNRYIRLIGRESILYFLAHLIYSIDWLVASLDLNNGGALSLAMDMLSYILLFTLSPRFIISVREMYTRDTQRFWDGTSGIDTGFGSGRQPSEVRFAHTGVDISGERDGNAGVC